jgi:hypothetical protein
LGITQKPSEHTPDGQSEFETHGDSHEQSEFCLSPAGQELVQPGAVQEQSGGELCVSPAGQAVAQPQIGSFG